MDRKSSSRAYTSSTLTVGREEERESGMRGLRL
jgi:hypothetical protein